MSEGFHVNAEQLRKHAANIEAIRARFGAVKSASAHIALNPQAYGALCAWMAGVLEGRHVKTDDLVAYVEENLNRAVRALRDSADEYTSIDNDNAALVRSAGGAR